MSALALQFDFGPEDEVAPAPEPRRRLYAVRGTVDARALAPAVAPAPARLEPASHPAPRLAAPAPALTRAVATPTLDVILGGAWEALAEGRPASCPVCATTLRRSAGPRGAVAHCGGCGSTLS